MIMPHHRVAGRIMFDLAKPKTRTKAWIAFEQIKALAAHGVPFALAVRSAIATIARRLMHKPDHSIGSVPQFQPRPRRRDELY